MPGREYTDPGSGTLKLPQTPLWRPAAGVARARLPRASAAWLCPGSSLTQRLQRACGAGFSVRVLSQGWASPWREEALLLRLAPGRRAFIRRVQLLCNGTAWVFGRTVIPPRTLRGKRRRLTHLGATPLGALLFADPTLHRDAVEFARLVPGHDLHADAAPDSATLWARRSHYRLEGRPLLVTEVFLPAIPAPAAPEPLTRGVDRRNGAHHG